MLEGDGCVWIVGVLIVLIVGLGFGDDLGLLVGGLINYKWLVICDGVE